MLIVLLLVFRSVFAALLPVIVGGTVVAASQGVLHLLLAFVDLDLFTHELFSKTASLGERDWHLDGTGVAELRLGIHIPKAGVGEEALQCRLVAQREHVPEADTLLSEAVNDLAIGLLVDLDQAGCFEHGHKLGHLGQGRSLVDPSGGG